MNSRSSHMVQPQFNTMKGRGINGRGFGTRGPPMLYTAFIIAAAFCTGGGFSSVSMYRKITINNSFRYTIVYDAITLSFSKLKKCCSKSNSGS